MFNGKKHIVLREIQTFKRYTRMGSLLQIDNLLSIPIKIRFKTFSLRNKCLKKNGQRCYKNRIKRAIRENFKVHKQNIIAKDIIVIEATSKDMNTLEIQSSLEHVLKIAKVFNKKD